MTLVSPSSVLALVARAVPKQFHQNIVVVGSLAAGYQFFGAASGLQVRTKDVDCLLSPRVKALSAGQAVAERLFAEGWQLRAEGRWAMPGGADTPEKELPLVRLYPPGSTEWFIELLTVPESESDLERKDSRLVTSRGHFSLCSFGFLALADFQPISTPFGIYVARAEMMALANLLHHPVIGAERMSGLIEGRAIKRSNKDLGRVLALALLAEARQEDVLLQWPQLWAEALRNRFPVAWPNLAAKAGSGMRQLLRPENDTDLEEAHYSCQYGLLATQAPSRKLLEVTAKRLLQDAIEPLEQLGRPSL